MYTLGIILLFVTGYLVVFNLSTGTTRLERLGLAFPAGVGTITFVMAIMDMLAIPLTSVSLTIASVVVAAALVVILVRKRNDVFEALKRPINFKDFNFVWLLLLAFAVWLEYANFAKCIYLPVYDRDSLAAFDTMGFVAAQEHTYGGMSIFAGDYMPGIHSPGSPMAYFPLVQLAYMYVYAMGAETSKIIPALMYLSFLVAFYAIVSRSTSSTAAMAATLLVLLTPEMTSFSSLSGTNVMHAVYAASGMISILTWFGNHESKYLAIGSFMLTCNTWCRAEGIVFVGVAALIVLYACAREKAYQNIVAIALAIVPVAVWKIYTLRFGLTVESFVITHPYFDGEKMSVVFDGAIALLKNTQYYGWTFTALMLAVVADAYFMLRRRADVIKLGAIVVALFLYYVIIYQVDYKWDSIDNVLAYSAKRFMFCFVPLAWYFVATCTPVTALMKKFDTFMSK